MGKKFILIFFLSLLCLNVKAANIDSLHKVLYKAFLAETKAKSDAHFKESLIWVEDDSSRAYYNYFKYYYFYKNQIKDSTQFYYTKAIDGLYNTQQYPEFFRLRNNFFWDLIDESKYDEAVRIGLENIEYAEQLKDTGNQMEFTAHLAVVYHDIAEYEKGIETAQRGLKISDDPKYTYARIYCYNAIGICFDDWGKYDSAIYYHRLNLSLQENDGSKDLSQTLNNLGNTYSKLNELDSAIKYISRAVEIDKSLRNDYSMATSLNNLGGLLRRQKKYKEAKFYLDTALFYAQKSNNTEKKRDVYYNLYSYHNDLQNYKKALSYLDLYHTFKDSMLNNERVKIINDLEYKAKEAKLSEKVSQAEAATNLRNFWIVLVTGFLLIMILVARQLYLKRKQSVKEAQLRLQNERLRISRDLHDNLGAELTYISSIIDQKVYDVKDPEKKAELENISNSSRHAMDQMRETIWAIKTDEITLSKFANKVKNTSLKYASAANMELDIRTSGEDIVMPPSKVIVLFRVCQEAINNAVKYSHGQKISLEMNLENQAYTLTIKDDGLGFDPKTVKRGYGLNNMEERMAEIEGTFEIHSAQSLGTTVTLKGPLAL